MAITTTINITKCSRREAEASKETSEFGLRDFIHVLRIHIIIIFIQVSDWKCEEIAKWLKEIELPNLTEKIRGTTLSGRHLLTMPEQTLIDGLQIQDDDEVRDI